MCALAHVPEQWHQVIQEAINIRMGAKASLYQFRIVRAIEACTFLQLIMTAWKVDGS